MEFIADLVADMEKAGMRDEEIRAVAEELLTLRNFATLKLKT